MRTAVIIPTYNERENIEALIEEILALPISAHIIVVDDNSLDGTGEVAEELAQRHQEVGVIHRPGKLGLGTAYIAGFKRALALGTEYIVTMDADFSHQPCYLPRLVAEGKKSGLVIGSRYIEGGGISRWSLARRILSWGGNTTARLVLGLEARDCTSGFRCYRREVLESIDLDGTFSSGYSFLIEMLYRCQQMGHRISEVPIIFEDRHGGASKVSRREVFKALYTVLRLGRERVLAASRGKSQWNT